MGSGWKACRIRRVSWFEYMYNVDVLQYTINEERVYLSSHFKFIQLTQTRYYKNVRIIFNLNFFPCPLLLSRVYWRVCQSRLCMHIHVKYMYFECIGHKKCIVFEPCRRSSEWSFILDISYLHGKVGRWNICWEVCSWVSKVVSV